MKKLPRPHLPHRKKKFTEEKPYPFEMGYRVPAEWEPHEATWMGWPHNVEDWPGKITPVPWVYGEMVRKIAVGEKVRIIVEGKEHQDSAYKILHDAGADLKNVEFFHFKTNRGWTRDSGPAFIVNDNETALVNFNFNAWAKYSNYRKDDKLPEFIADEFGIKKFNAVHKGKHVVIEGGSIDTNGKGTLITTEECLMDAEIQVRNPGFTKEDYSEIFKKYLKRWLEK